MELWGSIRAWRDRWSVRKHAPLLQRRLMADYGASEFYTVGQVRAAMGRVGLPDFLVAAGYAAFLSEADFGSVPGMQGRYQELRSVMRSCLGAGPAQAWTSAAENDYAGSGRGGHSGSF